MAQKLQEATILYGQIVHICEFDFGFSNSQIVPVCQTAVYGEMG